VTRGHGVEAKATVFSCLLAVLEVEDSFRDSFRGPHAPLVGSSGTYVPSAPELATRLNCWIESRRHRRCELELPSGLSCRDPVFNSVTNMTRPVCSHILRYRRDPTVADRRRQSSCIVKSSSHLGLRRDTTQRLSRVGVANVNWS